VVLPEQTVPAFWPDEKVRDDRAQRFPVATPMPLATPSLAGALSPIPGLILQDGFGGFDPPRITIRGSGLQSAPVNRGILLRFDGIPLNAADGSFNIAFL